jgi:Ca2+-binding RTX toxin-like protein
MATINGTSDNDFLTGTAGADTIYGHEGIDEIKGEKGNDLLLGGDGDDAIDGGEGNDRIDGGPGNDNLGGGHPDFGNDSIAGGDGDDVIGGGLGNDTLDGGDGNDFFFRGSGDNRIFGGAGNDTYGGGGGQDIVYGGSGDDVFLLDGPSSSSTATMTGGAGRDLYVFGEFVVVGPEGLRVNVITDFQAGPGGDQLDLDQLLIESGIRYGYEGGNPFNSASGVFRFVQSGADALLQWNVGQPNASDEWKTVYRLKNLSASTLTADNIVGGIPPNGSAVPGEVLTGTADADSLQGGFFNDTISGADGGDALDGRGGNDSIDGGPGDDTITGGAGNDRLLGGIGNDLFVVDSTGTASQATGGAGADTYRLEIGFLKEHRGYVVTDFTAGAGGDLIDVNPLLIHSIIPYGTQPLTLGYTGGNPFATDFLRWVQAGADVKLQWDSDGPDDNFAGWQTVLTLKNLQVADLPVDNMVSWIPPDGSTIAGRTITGTGGNDQLLGSIFGDQGSGLEGNDVLRGNAGHDVLDGGAGDDSLAGGLGNDTVYGGAGNDWLYDLDKDEPSAFGNDWLYGGAGDDEFGDVFGNNRLYGEDGNDSFRLGSNGGIFWSGADTVTGGAGADVYWIQVDMNRLVSVKDRVTDFAAGPGGDLLDLRNLPIGVFKTAFELGHLELRQSGANTLLRFDLDGSAGAGFAPVTLVTLQGVTASSITSDNFLGELIVGTPANDDLVGGLGNDTVQGLAGNDTLDGALGADILEGGSGSDVYFVDNADDETIEESNGLPGGLAIGGGGSGLAADYIDTVRAAVDYALSNFVENLTLAGSARHGTGNELANVIKGNAKANTLTGGDGNDRMDGSDGNDTLDGGGGSDRLIGGKGNDVLVWGDGDRLDGGAGTDTMKITTGDVDLPGELIRNVEIIDLRGGDASSLTLTAADVLAMSPTDSVRILGDEGDTVGATGFTAQGGPVNGLQTYRSGTATLLVEVDVGVD